MNYKIWVNMDTIWNDAVLPYEKGKSAIEQVSVSKYSERMNCVSVWPPWWGFDNLTQIKENQKMFGINGSLILQFWFPKLACSAWNYS